MSQLKKAKHYPLECVNVRCPQKYWCGGCDPHGDEPCSKNPWPCRKANK